MTSVTLLHPEEIFKIPTLQAMTKCNLFQNNPLLLVAPSRLQSPVSLFIFREFMSALEGNAIKDTNFTELFQPLSLPEDLSPRCFIAGKTDCSLYIWNSGGVAKKRSGGIKHP
jgi:hypothetical protein